MTEENRSTIRLHSFLIKTLLLFSILILLLVARSSFAGIVNTKHDLTAGFGTTVTDSTVGVCGLCHLPHGGKALPGKPLWAKAEPAGPVTYNLYGGGLTLSRTRINTPGPPSLACLSCHDGTIGLSTIVKNGVTITFSVTTNLPGGLSPTGAFQAVNIDPLTGYSPYIGTDLRNDHPVGFDFPASGYGVGGGIPGISLTIINGGTADAHLLGSSGAHYPLYQSAGANGFECSTCHDPHQPPIQGQTKFLRAANALLCQDCHNTK